MLSINRVNPDEKSLRETLTRDFMDQLPTEIEKKLAEFQSAQEQLQAISSQKFQLKMQEDELDSALKSVKEANGKVFKSTGFVVVEAEKDKLTAELEEKKESVAVRLQVVSKQEDKFKKRALELRTEIEAVAKQMPKN